MQHKEYAVIPLLSLLGTIGKATASNELIGKAVQAEVAEELNKIPKQDAIEGAKAMQQCIRQHFQQRFPNSKHYRPSRVTRAFNYVYVNVPGVTRAYQDIDIYPKNAAWLCIPVNSAAKGRSPSEFSNLFKPKDHNILAANEGGKLVVYYALSKHVHQKQDSTIMPTDEKLADVASEAMAKRFD